MDKTEFGTRTKNYALQILRLVAQLAPSARNQILGRQLLRAATSVGANYRAACRAKSRADFISKLKISEEECDESLYWLELMTEGGLVGLDAVSGLMMEANEILAVLVTSIKTARSRS